MKSRGKEEEGSAFALHRLPGQVLSDEDVTGGRWFETAPAWPSEKEGGLRASLSEWGAVAEQALASATRMYEKKVSGRKSEDVGKALGKEKTVGDRIAAVTLLVQESPLHRLEELRVLFGFAEKKGRRERGPAIDALKDLFIHDLLPDERRLVRFEDREFTCGKQALSKRHLAYARFESELKKLYRDFLAILEECGRDTVAHFKQKAVRVTFDLLLAKPENEKALLAMLVNKLGDPERKVSSSASYNLARLIEKHHPQMRLIVVREVEHLIRRPNVSRRTQYYAISFLNQMRFREGEDVELSRRMLRIYMELFTTCIDGDRNAQKLKKEGGVESKESRLMGALLNGVNRAYPFTQPDQDASSYDTYYDALFRVAHAQSLSSATQAMSFLFQVAQSNATQSDRFYRALYSRICDAAGAGESKQAAFLNLIYKAMKGDVNSRRVKAFAKRLLQSAAYGTPGYAGGCLMVISEALARGRSGLLKAFVTLAEGDDEEEEFRDVDDGVGANSEESEPEEDAKDPGGGTPSGTKPELDKNESSGDKGEDETIVRDDEAAIGYNPAKREPLYAGAEQSCLWELSLLCTHYHPSVVNFAKSLCLNTSAIKYSGDPLKDFASSSFLDKFCYKKPKKHILDSLHGRRASRQSDVLLANTEQFQELAHSGLIAEDEKFFLRYFESNPGRVIRKHDPSDKKVASRDGDHKNASDADSEEEAFEDALRVEMRRLGAEEGFLSKDINKELGDVDQEDEDEMREFAKAFGDEMMMSDDNEADEDDFETNAQSGKRGQKRGGMGLSVFAAAEDFSEAIADRDAKEADMADEEDEEDENEAASTGEKMEKARSSSRSQERGRRRKAKRART